MSYSLEEYASGSGIKIQGTVSTAVSKYDLLMLIGTGQWRPSNVTTYYVPTVGMATEDIPAGRRGTILLHGVIHSNAWAWTPGVELYTSTVDGEMVQVPPLGMGNAIQEVGMAFTANLVYFAPKRSGNLVAITPTSCDKIYDITHADTDPHSVNLPASCPANTSALVVTVQRTGSGNLYLRSGSLGCNMILGQNGWGLWLRSITDGKFHYGLGTANDDWDVYLIGYITA